MNALRNLPFVGGDKAAWNCVKESRFWSWMHLYLNPDSATGCVTLNKLPNLSERLFLHL